MRNHITRSLAVLSFLVILASAGQSQSAPRDTDLPNFAKVSEKLYRGAQPTREGFRRLKELGVTTVINLRCEDELAVAEKEAVESAGLRYFNVGLPGLSGPSDEQVARVMTIIDAPESSPVFIHCRRGSDRTGTIAAVYRISHEGWTAEEALAEAKRYGLSFAEFGMKRYIADYYRDHVKSKPAAATASR